MRLLSRPCTIVERGASDEVEFGVPERDEGELETVCEIQQRQRTEPAQQGELSITTWDAFFPPDTVINANDQVIVEDLGEFELIGDPWNADTGSRAVAHVEATLRRTGGEEGS